MTTDNPNSSCVFIHGNNTLFYEHLLVEDLMELLGEGYNTFYTTLHSGFDYTAIEALMSMQSHDEDGRPHINIIVVIDSFNDTIKHDSMDDVERFIHIADRVQKVIFLRGDDAHPRGSIYFCRSRCSYTLHNRCKLPLDL